MSQIRENNQGFTLVEVLVTVFIIGVVVTGLYGILAWNIRLAVSISNNYAASLLAQEGIEVVRNIRDTEWQQSSSFGLSLPDGDYSVQYDSSALGNDQDEYLSFDAPTGSFSYNGSVDTIFKREIVISSPTVDQKAVVVNVTWREYGNDKTLSAEDRLFNWK
jgi:prepilin-type N-terminal cleavage/methylation domain-containing protein